MSNPEYEFLNCSNLKGSRKNTWGKIFSSSLPEIAKALTPYAAKAECTQKIRKTTVDWFDGNGALQAMFCIVPEPSDLKAIRSIYNRIAKFSPEYTYVIVHQKPDGIGNYDIFCLTPESYLNHCNRVYHKK